MGNADVLMYTFENGKLSGVITMVSTAYTSEYAGYMAERFLMLPYETDANTYFIGADGLELTKANTVVVLEVYNYKYISAVYMPANKYSSSSKARIKEMMRNLPVNIQ